ncbi:flagella basal body P-ring formation protein FlgA [Brevundimonas sp. UBA7534]|uniref:flagella basal body P-ring formation protein FlgA n=1 Tax=Brevundimonas sp. UBA7534 TaxID=1946138 RepID=UPI0025C5AFE6|nr:flagella basal body P-ring formation protein FlgA [Brevundimonas sp. UBA7534]
MTLLHRTLALSAALVALAGPALAAPVTLKTNPVDDDGRVTLGDIFDGAGGAADVMVARRVGPSVVMEAGQLQALARQAGLDWTNPNGLRRVAVRQGVDAPGAAPTVQAAAASASIRPAARRPAARETVIKRNDMVRVTYEVGGVKLAVLGRAMRDAAVGEPVAVTNTTSNRIIDAVAAGPGQAIAGPAGDAIRADALSQFAAR